MQTLVMTVTSRESMFINLSAYKFIPLDGLPQRRAELLRLCTELGLKGTILISAEGLNVFVAGSGAAIEQLIDWFESRSEYAGLPIKKSESDEQPFTRMLVRIKKEIIAFGVEEIDPAVRTSPKLAPAELKQWLDEGREVTLLDVRNDYEVDLGTFRNARAVGIDHFRNFPTAVKALPELMKRDTVVMFCTGGIRCEKAGPLLESLGFENVYQLDGGILKYFEDCGGDHYDGECFVFDKRVALDPDLQESGTTQCYACQHPLTVADQKSDRYVAGKSCLHCFQSEQESMQQRLQTRNAQIRGFCHPLPGARPYDNHRPMNVPLRFDGADIHRFLLDYHPHIESDYWKTEIQQGRILYKDRPVAVGSTVWAGQRLVHLIAGTVEPPVNANIELIYEDQELIAVNKPAPLAMHPCGRFNRNTLTYILNAVYVGEKIRMIHRLDANTTGVVVMARKRKTAQQVQAQFENGRVAKTYLARVLGQPDADNFACHAPISARPSQAGVRLIDKDGLPASTEFKVLNRYDDATTLIECVPLTGRTNQIRLHLWSLGLPIVNDPSYLPESQIGYESDPGD